MKPARAESDYTTDGGELSLSGLGLAELLTAILEKGKEFRFRARGSSMWPFLKSGDLITVSPLTAKRPGLGDVVVFLRPSSGRPVVHRIVGKKDGSYLIKGDNTAEYDGLMEEKDILGRITLVERGERRISYSLGPTRFLIAGMSRSGLLPYLRPVKKKIVRFFKRRS